MYKTILLTLLFSLLCACGFHLQGEMPLAPPLHCLYLQICDPYGRLARTLRENLRLSHVTLVNSPAEAQTVLVILQDVETETLLSVNSTLQTSQYNLNDTVTFQVTDAHNQILIPTQTICENRIITTQSNLILGSSNEANLFFQQMKRDIAFKILVRLASRDITTALLIAMAPPPPPLLRAPS